MPDARRSTRTHAGAADYVGPPGRVVRLLKKCRFTFRGGTIGLSRVHEVMHLYSSNTLEGSPPYPSMANATVPSSPACSTRISSGQPFRDQIAGSTVSRVALASALEAIDGGAGNNSGLPQARKPWGPTRCPRGRFIAQSSEAFQAPIVSTVTYWVPGGIRTWPR
jgi:hypothetical protein